MKSYRSSSTFVTVDLKMDGVILASAPKIKFVGVGGGPVLLKQYSQYAC